MSTFVYMTRCDGCGHCVDICPSDIMHIDENIRRAKNIEPNFCWECYSCVKACPNHAIDVRGYADFAPMVIGDTKSFSVPFLNFIFQEIVPFSSSLRTLTLCPIGAKSAYPLTSIAWLGHALTHE